MKWLKRTLWLAAWSVWLWLGFGLYRELPRDLGRVFCTIPLHGMNPIGLNDNFVVAEETNEMGRRRIAAWGFCSGKKVFDRSGPLDAHPYGISARWEVVWGRWTEVDEEENALGPLEVQELWTDTRFEVGAECRAASFHPTRPWLAVYEHRTGKPIRFGVVDVAKRIWIAKWSEPPTQDASERVHTAEWVGDDELLIALSTREDDGEYRVQRLIHWRPQAGKWGPAIAVSPSHSWVFRPSENGRVLLALTKEAPTTTVLEHRTGEVLWTTTEIDDLSAWREVGHWTQFPVFSANGKSLLSPDGDLWSVDERRLLRRRKPTDLHWSATATSDRFFVEENWNRHELIAWMGLNAAANTTAVRSFNDGRVIYRVYGQHPDASCMFPDGRFGVHFDGENGSSYQLPPRPNWMLVSVCQTILALPLVCFWCIRRWQRHRKTRLE